MEATVLARKGELLEGAGYVYSFDREVYYNTAAKKAFSVEFVEDHSPEELERHIHENTNGEEWRFYFNTPISASARRELEGVLR